MEADSFSLTECGSKYTNSYRLFLLHDEKPASFVHDVPLVCGNLYNMVVEVPRWTQAKMEISKNIPLNPIVQDIKKGKMRYVANVFPHHGYIWNYGALPQTWEDPNYKDPDTNCTGDNDPIDACDIGSRRCASGEIIQVKVLGILAMIDEGETDWKVIVINTDDPQASEINNIKDVEKHRPGLLRATVEWFKYYKVPDGKPVNKFAFNEEYKDREYAIKVIEHTHSQWKKLISGESHNEVFRTINQSIKDSENFTNDSLAVFRQQSTPLGEPGEIPPSVYHVSYDN